MAKETEETEGEDATASIKPPSKQTDDQEGEGGAMAGDTETPAKPKPPRKWKPFVEDGIRRVPNLGSHYRHQRRCKQVKCFLQLFVHVRGSYVCTC